MGPVISRALRLYNQPQTGQDDGRVSAKSLANVVVVENHVGGHVNHIGLKSTPNLSCLAGAMEANGPPLGTAESTPHLGDADSGNFSLEQIGIVHVCLYDYEARSEKEISFKKGEIVKIPYCSHHYWWFGWNTVTQEKGFIPSNYVAQVNSIKAEKWYFGNLNPITTLQLLLSPECSDGTFLVRESERTPGNFFLHVRFQFAVEHYEITHDDGFFITSHGSKSSFQTLQELVQHYSTAANGLCINLRNPCIQIDKPITSGMSYTTRNDWEVERESIALVREIGQGSYGKVHSATWNSSVRVAVKTMKRGAMNSAEFLAEAEIMKTLVHPNVVQLYAVCSRPTNQPILIVTELMNGSLLHLLQHEREMLTVRELVRMAAQIATGMAYLEANHYLHRDLAARNVLVGDQNLVKIADFGMARIIRRDVYEGGVPFRKGTGPREPHRWTAPEATRALMFSTKSDVWSFGIVLIEMFTCGNLPYPGWTDAQALLQVERGYRMPPPLKCPLPIYQMMLKMWHKKPEMRPPFNLLQLQLEDFFYRKFSRLEG